MKSNGISRLGQIIFAQALFMCSLFIWYFISMFSPMFADGGVDDKVVFMVVFAKSMPFFVLGLNVLMWFAYTKHKDKLMKIVYVLLFLSLLPALSMF